MAFGGPFNVFTEIRDIVSFVQLPLSHETQAVMLNLEFLKYLRIVYLQLM